MYFFFDVREGGSTVGPELQLPQTSHRVDDEVMPDAKAFRYILSRKMWLLAKILLIFATKML